MRIVGIKEEHLVAIVFLLVLGLVVAFFSNFAGDAPPPAPVPPSVDPCAVPVNARCEVETEREFEDCDDTRRIEDSMNALLANPEKSDACEASKLKLGETCPEGCTVDYSSLYQVAGGVQLDVVTKTEKGCLLRGKRQVSMRASCAKDPNYVPPAPATPEG